MVGNHDDRAALRAAFQRSRRIAQRRRVRAIRGRYRSAAPDRARFDGAGRKRAAICATRVSRGSQAQLDAAQGKPVIVALHHPPFACGIGHMDELRLDPHAAEKLAALIARYPNVERVICGHVHRPMFVRFGGTIASAVPAPAHQVALDLREDAPSAFMMEPPAFALHRYDAGHGHRDASCVCRCSGRPVSVLRARRRVDRLKRAEAEW